jgi:hypothetical protein
MRDKERIPIILKRLEQLWLRYDQMRLGQLLENVFPNRPGMEAKFSRTAYYIEDEDLISTLEKFYASESTYGYMGKEVIKKILKDVKDEPLQKKP